MLFKGIEIYSNEAKEIEVVDGVIRDIRPAQYDSSLPYISRGFIDMQVNGYMGIDYSSDDLSVEGIVELCHAMHRTGSLRHVPTIITNSEERIIRNLRVIREAVDSEPIVKASVAGVHIEGPYISTKDGPRGAHDILFVRDPSVEEFHRWQEAAGGLIKIVTIAPEKAGAVEFIKAVSREGVNVAIGHCEPTVEQLYAAVEAGAKLSTHLGNGSSGLLPRLKNHIWQQLADDRLIGGFISDGYHVPEYTMRAMYRSKGPDNTILVSDVAPPGGMAAGLTKWGNIDVEVHQDGHLGLWNTEFLAGAGHLLDYDLVQFMRFTGASLAEAIKLVTENPAKVLGVGSGQEFTVGEKADIISFRIGERLTDIEYAIG